MSSHELQEQLKEWERIVATHENHAVVRKLAEAKAKIEEVKAAMAKEDAFEVKLSDVPDLAPKKAASARKAASTRTTAPVSRSKTSPAKTTTDKKDLSET